MPSGDVLLDALMYALDETRALRMPVAMLNASGLETKEFVNQSHHNCNNDKHTLNGVFNTVLVRATRQTDETLGLVAMALAHSDAGAYIFVAQENTHGANALEKALTKAFSGIRTVIKYKCRVMVLEADTADRTMIADWAARAAMRLVSATGLWSQPGLFAWDRLDAGSRLLLEHLPEKLTGAVADLGCGYGYLSQALIKRPGVTHLYAMDIDARAVDAARKNLDAVATTVPYDVYWRDATVAHADIPKLDFVVSNPPFHNQQHEDRALGQKFCMSALKMLKSRGMLYVVANKHMPYEAILEKGAKKVTVLAMRDGFKILMAEAA